MVKTTNTWILRFRFQAAIAAYLPTSAMNPDARNLAETDY